MRADTYLTKVRRFHEVFNHPLDKAEVHRDLDMLRYRLVEEEFKEYGDALEELRYLLGVEATEGPDDALAMRIEQARSHLLKEMADLIVVVVGHAAVRGWNIDVAFNRVMASNMSKLGEDGKPIYREDGKILKGPNYKEPNLKDLI